jgi:hypothetical protein
MSQRNVDRPLADSKCGPEGKTGVTNARLTHMDGHAVLIYIHVAQGSNASDRYSV